MTDTGRTIFGGTGGGGEPGAMLDGPTYTFRNNGFTLDSFSTVQPEYSDNEKNYNENCPPPFDDGVLVITDLDPGTRFTPSAPGVWWLQWTIAVDNGVGAESVFLESLVSLDNQPVEIRVLQTLPSFGNQRHAASCLLVVYYTPQPIDFKLSDLSGSVDVGQIDLVLQRIGSI